MKFLDLSLPEPAENLAADEALLDTAEAGAGGEVLRCWESPLPFVVIGYANKTDTEVNRAACAELQVPVLRRCSGGGTVVQGPGCLNYSLVLEIAALSALGGITSTNRFIMERNRDALARLLKRPVEIQGHTDLTLGGLKFSGNAQRRKKKFLLFHGTLLLDYDLSRITRLLPFPSLQPDYRQNRAHQVFLTNLHAPTALVKEVLREAWQAGQPLLNPPLETIRALTRDRYSKADWNEKF
jgi:lipoate-protein ligase A